jgi:hypothetical protein
MARRKPIKQVECMCTTKNDNDVHLNCVCDEYSYGNTRKVRGKAYRQVKVLRSFKVNRLLVDYSATGSGT